jgi:DNA-binding transcriptional ArsR family regulator
MQHELIDSNGGNPVAYDSLVVAPDKLGVFNSPLSLRIIKELVAEPGCAMDLSRKLNQHEQKIYYHLRRLESAGVIKQIRTEKRSSMTAKIYGVVSPVVSTKLYEGGKKAAPCASKMSKSMGKFFAPFIEEGEMNALVVIGDSYSHGRFDSFAKEAAHSFDLAMLMGKHVTSPKFPHYKLDTEIQKEDLKKNLILIGNPETNTVIDKMNSILHLFFDKKDKWSINSRHTSESYKDPRIGVIAKLRNPVAKDKWILIVGGRTRGTRAAIIALTGHWDQISGGNNGDEMVRIVKGFDRTGDSIIDDIKVLE